MYNSKKVLSVSWKKRPNEKQMPEDDLAFKKNQLEELEKIKNIIEDHFHELDEFDKLQR